MQSKFSLLPIGQRFTYQEKNYIKVSPLIASEGEKGAQRMIPRSAMVEIAGEGAVSPARKEATALTPEAVVAAFDASRDWLLSQLTAPSPELAALLLEQRQRFLDSLGNDTP